MSARALHHPPARERPARATASSGPARPARAPAPAATHLAPPRARRPGRRPAVAVSLALHAGVAGLCLAASLLGAAPARRGVPAPDITVELAILAAPAPEAPARPGFPDLATTLPAPDAPPAPLVTPRATELAATLPRAEAPPPPDLRRPTPPRPTPARPARPPPRAAAHPAPARSASSPPPAGQSHASAPTGATSPASPLPLRIAAPRFRLPPRPPVYPRRAAELGEQGEVVVRAVLDPGGTPTALSVLRSSGHPLLDRAALEAVRGWAFEPGRRAGIAVAAWVEIPVRFTLR